MIRFSSSRRVSLILGVLLGFLPVLSFGQTRRPQLPSKDVPEQWRTLEESAKADLVHAASCTRAGAKTGGCIYAAVVKNAYVAYVQMAKQLPSTNPNSSMVLTAANGFVKTGHAYDAVKLLQRFDISKEPDLLHMLGDALYFMKDYRSAAEAYRGWMELGCKGFLIDPDDEGLWAVQKTLPRCSTLPVLLRAQLEYIDERLPEDDPGLQLPEVNVPAVRSTAQ